MILIVEDDVDTSDLIKMYLKEYDSVAVGTVTEALEVFGKSEFSLVIIDIKLPDFTGTYLAEKIRSTSEVPILFLTNYSTDMTELVSNKLGIAYKHKSEVLGKSSILKDIIKDILGEDNGI